MKHIAHSLRHIIFASCLCFTLVSNVEAKPQGSQKTEPPVPSSPAEKSADQRRHALYGEVLGRAFFYSLGYDYSFIPQLAAGIGISFIDADLAFFELRDTLGIPVYLNYYPITGKHRILITAGATAYWGKIGAGSFWSDVFGDSATGNLESFHILIGTFGVGYELHSKFLFRGVLYALFSDKGVVPFVGASFGGTL